MKFYTTTIDRGILELRLNALVELYNLDVEIIEESELHGLSGKNILYLGDSVLSIIRLIKRPDKNRFFTFHSPNFLRNNKEIKIHGVPDYYCMNLIKSCNAKTYRPNAWQDKIGKFKFAGHLTGSNYELLNKRCTWAKVTNGYSLVSNTMLKCGNKNEYKEFKYSEAIDESQIYSHKFIINIDGNGARWCTINDLLSNCLLVRLTSCFSLFYENLLVPYENYIPLDLDYGRFHLVLIKRTYENNKESQRIIKNANDTALEVLDMTKNWNPEKAIEFI